MKKEVEEKGHRESPPGSSRRLGSGSQSGSKQTGREKGQEPGAHPTSTDEATEKE